MHSRIQVASCYPYDGIAVVLNCLVCKVTGLGPNCSQYSQAKRRALRTRYTQRRRATTSRHSKNGLNKVRNELRLRNLYFVEERLAQSAFNQMDGSDAVWMLFAIWPSTSCTTVPCPTAICACLMITLPPPNMALE